MKQSRTFHTQATTTSSYLYIAMCAWTLLVNMLLIIVNPLAGVFVLAVTYLFFVRPQPSARKIARYLKSRRKAYFQAFNS